MLSMQQIRNLVNSMQKGINDYLTIAENKKTWSTNLKISFFQNYKSEGVQRAKKIKVYLVHLNSKMENLAYSEMKEPLIQFLTLIQACFLSESRMLKDHILDRFCQFSTDFENLASFSEVFLYFYTPAKLSYDEFERKLKLNSREIYDAIHDPKSNLNTLFGPGKFLAALRNVFPKVPWDGSHRDFQELIHLTFARVAGQLIDEIATPNVNCAGLLHNINDKSKEANVALIDNILECQEIQVANKYEFEIESPRLG